MAFSLNASENLKIRVAVTQRHVVENEKVRVAVTQKHVLFCCKIYRRKSKHPIYCKYTYMGQEVFHYSAIFS